METSMKFIEFMKKFGSEDFCKVFLPINSWVEDFAAVATELTNR